MANNASSVVSWVRDIAPSHYILKIESFSSLAKILSGIGTKFYKSKVFEASGHKWTLSIYPNGDGDSNGHISVSLCIEDTNVLPLHWEINTELKFFIFDQKRDKYSIFQDGRVNRFHRLKTEWGISKLVSRAVFDDAVNGYLVNDKCVFGVEVFVLESKFTGEFLSPSVEVDKTFTWKVSDYSNLGNEVYSDEFTADSLRWRLLLQKSRGQSLSLFLELVDQQITCARLLVRYMLSIKDQQFGKHAEKETCGCFTPKSNWGWSQFMSLTNLQNESKGFVVSNCMMIEAHIKNVSTIDN